MRDEEDTSVMILRYSVGAWRRMLLDVVTKKLKLESAVKVATLERFNADPVGAAAL